MLLGPHHFQQLSARFEELQHLHSTLISPYHWGVRHLKIDPVLLVEGKFRVLELEAVLPDGLGVSSLQLDEESLTLDLAEAVEDPTAGPFKVHLAVPARRRGGSAVQGELARYESVEGAPVADLNTGEGELVVPRLRPRIVLLVGDTPPDKYTSFPLAEVGYVNEAFALTSFVPPLLTVPLRSPLGEVCSSLASRLREKAALLSEELRSPSASRRAPQLVESKARLQCLVAALPPFEAVLNTGVAHPFVLYLATCSLAGQLAGLGASLVPPAFKRYDHNDLWATFRRTTDFAHRVLREGFIESHVGYPLALSGGVYSLPFDPAWAGRSLVLGVRAPSGLSERETGDWLERAVIGSRSTVEPIRRKRILGVAREWSEGEGELVPTRGVVLYALDASSEFLVPEDTLQVFNPDDPDAARGPAEIVLYVRKPAAGEEPEG